MKCSKCGKTLVQTYGLSWLEEGELCRQFEYTCPKCGHTVVTNFIDKTSSSGGMESYLMNHPKDAEGKIDYAKRILHNRLDSAMYDIEDDVFLKIYENRKYEVNSAFKQIIVDLADCKRE